MSSIREIYVADPRNPGLRCLRASIIVTRPTVPPHGHGEHFDPGAGAEFTISTLLNESGTPARIRSHAQMQTVSQAISDTLDAEA